MKDRPQKSMPSTFTIWAPPGRSLLVSPGVEVRTMAPEPEVRRLETRRSNRLGTAVRPEPLSPSGRVSVPAVGGRWKIPAHWMDVAGQPGQEAPGQSQDMFVPPEIIAQAEQAMQHWDMKVSGMQVMATKQEKGGAIWRIDTNRGPRSLKLLHRPPARSLFSIGLQDYLVQKGARVPALIPSKEGGLSVELDGKLWIVTDWIENLVPAGKGLDGAQALCYGLGEFHRWSKGYVPPKGAQKASRLYRWPRAYQKMQLKMSWFRELAQAYAEAPAAATVLGLVDPFEQQARDALARLESSPYASLVARGEPEWGVVHQDNR